MRTYFKYLKPFFPRMSVGLAIKFAGTIFDLLIPVMLKIIIDDVVPTKNAGMIYFYGGVMIVCSILAEQNGVPRRERVNAPSAPRPFRQDAVSLLRSDGQVHDPVSRIPPHVGHV